MRRTLPALTAVAAALTIGSSALASGMTTVQIDQATRLPVSGSAASVFVGNASIADVAVVNSGTVMVIGKAYGLTNVVVLDRAGRTLMDRQVQVSPGNDGRMTLYRAAVPNNFTCSPTCERTPMPGEPNTGVFDAYTAPYDAYGARQRSGGGTGGSGGGK